MIGEPRLLVDPFVQSPFTDVVIKGSARFTQEEGESLPVIFHVGVLLQKEERLARALDASLLRGDSEKIFDALHQVKYVSFWCPEDLTFADHVHGFVSHKGG